MSDFWRSLFDVELAGGERVTHVFDLEAGTHTRVVERADGEVLLETKPDGTIEEGRERFRQLRGDD